MSGNRPSSRSRILAAAAALARDAGPGRLSLDAVAARAGVSKGGLLYHFPSKAALMAGLVEDYIAEFEAKLDSAITEGDTEEALMKAYIALSLKSLDEKQPPASWIFSAMAEDPDFLKPVNEFRRKLLQRLLSGSADRTKALMAYLAIEGMHSLKLFGSDQLSGEDRDMIEDHLLSQLNEQPTSSRQ
ncbi:TetR/AcrR family transcriptional regulator [Hoeflea sp. CAU 1731]